MTLTKLCDHYQNPVVEIKNLSFSYDQKQGKILDDVSLAIQSGEFLCLLGESGSGKTTLLRLIAGLQKPQSGSVCVNGEIDMRHHRIGMVFQDLALFSHMSVAKNVEFALRHLSRVERKQRVKDMLDFVGLSDKRSCYPHELSGGQKQRLAIARALAPKPDLILLDEPFISQDYNRRCQIRDDIMHILRASGVAALLVTHDPEEAMQFADRIAIMHDGRIEQIASPHKIYNDPATPYVASFFGQVNHFYGQIKNGGLQTDIGYIPVNDYSEGEKIHVIARPEAFRLENHDEAIDHHDPNHAHSHATIAESKYVGRSTLIHMDALDLDRNSKGSHLHVRVPGVHKISKSNVHDVFVDPSQVFVFKD